MKTYFTSDTHFWHKNILKFTDRPYNSVEEMTNDMIDKWNSQVNDDDIIYHLGDLCLGNLEQTIDVMTRLKGKIILIKGNHDFSKHYKKINQLGLLHEYYEIGTTLKHNKQQLFLTHYPLEIGVRPRMWSIHGHIHNEDSSDINHINVGVDSPHFKHKPFGELISLDELLEVIKNRDYAVEMQYKYG